MGKCHRHCCHLRVSSMRETSKTTAALARFLTFSECIEFIMPLATIIHLVVLSVVSSCTSEGLLCLITEVYLNLR